MQLLDRAVLVFYDCEAEVGEMSNDATIVKSKPAQEIPFAEWLRRGIVCADGIKKKLISKKQLGNVEVFEVEESQHSNSFVVKRGDIFSHGETIEKAIADLRYKISTRDTSEFESWKGDLDTKRNIDDIIRCYRVLTGACELGTKQFVERLGSVPETLSIREVFDITKGQFGSNEFKAFLSEGKN